MAHLAVEHSVVELSVARRRADHSRSSAGRLGVSWPIAKKWPGCLGQRMGIQVVILSRRRLAALDSVARAASGLRQSPVLWLVKAGVWSSPAIDPKTNCSNGRRDSSQASPWFFGSVKRALCATGWYSRRRVQRTNCPCPKQPHCAHAIPYPTIPRPGGLTAFKPKIRYFEISRIPSPGLFATGPLNAQQ